MRRLLALLLLLAVSAFAADFGPVFTQTILPHEGGYSCDRNDPGNWTGGKVGKGRLLGTKYGIAASVYGAELLRQGKTIAGLSVADAERLYKRDYWDANHLGELKSQGIAAELMDEIVNMGSGGGEALLAKVFAEIEWANGGVPVPVPARFEPATIAWINGYTATRANRIAFYNSVRLKRVRYYVELVQRRPAMRAYVLSWASRATEPAKK